jgi:hypothetical protein
LHIDLPITLSAHSLLLYISLSTTASTSELISALARLTASLPLCAVDRQVPLLDERHQQAQSTLPHRCIHRGLSVTQLSTVSAFYPRARRVTAISSIFRKLASTHL